MLKDNGTDTMMTDDDDKTDGEVSEEDLLEVNEAEGDENESEAEESTGFDEFGNPIDE